MKLFERQTLLRADPTETTGDPASTSPNVNSKQNSSLTNQILLHSVQMQEGLTPEPQPINYSSNVRTDQLHITFVARHPENTELAFFLQRTTFNMADSAVDEAFTSALSSVLQKQESIDSLKPEQVTALKTFLLKKDIFATLPIGFGKSLIYQLAPLVAKEMKPNENPVVVLVSPLLALMEQQVIEATKLGVIAMQLGVNSDEEILTGRPELLFGSPEAWLLKE